MAKLKPFERDAVGYLLRLLALGLLGSALFGGLILWTDFAGIRSLALAEEGGWLALGLLFFGLLSVAQYGRGPIADAVMAT